MTFLVIVIAAWLALAYLDGWKVATSVIGVTLAVCILIVGGIYFECQFMPYCT